MRRWLRWVLVIPGAWLAWYVALLAGLAVHAALAVGGSTAAWLLRCDRVRSFSDSASLHGER